MLVALKFLNIIWIILILSFLIEIKLTNLWSYLLASIHSTVEKFRFDNCDYCGYRCEITQEVSSKEKKNRWCKKDMV